MPRTLLMRTISREPRIMAHLLFEPRDCWTGIFWRPRKGRLDVYVCLVPMLPVKLSIGLPPRHIRRLQRFSGVARRKTRIKTERWHTFTRDIPVGRGTLGITLSLSCRGLYPRLPFRHWRVYAWRWRNGPGAWHPDDPAKRGWALRSFATFGGRRLHWLVFWSRPDTIDHVWVRLQNRNTYSTMRAWLLFEFVIDPLMAVTWWLWFPRPLRDLCERLAVWVDSFVP